MGKKNREKKRDKLKRYEPLLANLPEGFRGLPVTVDDPVGGVKISVVLLNYLKPYTEGLVDEELWNNVLRLGIIAWNAALLSSNTLKETLPGIVEAFPFSERQPVLGLLEQMIQRKKRFFADDGRYILEYRLRMEKDGPFLSVVSSGV